MCHNANNVNTIAKVQFHFECGYFDILTNMKILTETTSLCGISLLKCFCIVLVLVQIGEGMAKPVPPSNLPSNGKKHECYCIFYLLTTCILIGVQLYLPYHDKIIADYSMIHAGQFYSVDQNNDPDNTNDALWCQSANNNTNIGVWYYPNGTEVSLFDGDFTDSSAPSPVFSKRFSGQIALARRAALGGYEGLYKCIIPDENGVNQTLVVGIYTTGGYNSNG